MKSMEQPQQILFIQGAGDDAWEWSIPMINALKEDLGREYHILFPKMPHPEDPSYSSWKSALQKELLALDRNAILVGHSLGGSILLKYIAETNPAPSFKALFLLAPPYWGNDGWDSDEFKVQDAPKNITDALIFLYHNTDDEDVPFAHHLNYRSLLPAAHVTTGTHGGHAMLNLMPGMAREIRSLG